MWIFCHNFPKWFCVFQNSALQFTHSTSETVLLSPCHSFPYSLVRPFKLEPICNGIFYYTTLAGANRSLQALLVNVAVFSQSSGCQVLLSSVKAGLAKAFCHPLQSGRECPNSRKQLRWRNSWVRISWALESIHLGWASKPWSKLLTTLSEKCYHFC